MTRPADDELGFLGRWARRKAQVRSGKGEPDAAALARPPAAPPGTPPGTPPAAPPAPEPRQAVSKPTAEGQRPAGPAEPATWPSTAPSRLADAAAVQAAPVLVRSPAASGAARTADGQPAEPPAAPPTLADVEALAADAPDFSRFVSRGVSPDVHRAALKKLFADPHFNVMDGLDIYIDDYGKPDPLPAGMLRQLTQGRSLGLFPDEPETPDAASAEQAADVNTEQLAAANESEPAPPTTEPSADTADRAAAPVAGTTGDSPDAPDTPDADTAAPTHEDPDLQLQQQPAAGHPSVDAGAGASPVRRV
jgi:hypothetical protein